MPLQCSTPPPGGDVAQESPPSRIRFHDLLRQHAPAYLKAYGRSMPARQREVLNTILRCRTAASGGRVFRCQDCGHLHFAFHSCNNRHCPLCGQIDGEEWLERQRPRLLLPVPYFLITFTVPEFFRAWIRSHPKEGYALLFAASSQALQDLGQDPDRLGAQLGMLGILQTWTRTLIFHPHIHYLVPAGGLGLDQREWVGSRQPGYLLNEFALGDRCRNLFKKHLAKLYPALLAAMSTSVWEQRWVTDCSSVGSGEAALTYLSRYVFKTATGNCWLDLLPNSKIRWNYRDSKTGRDQDIPLDPQELLRRFLQHVLPRGFTRVRYFGWFHPAARQRLNRVRALLQQTPVLTPLETRVWKQEHPHPSLELSGPAEPLQELSSAPACPHCQRPMLLVAIWRAGNRVPALADPRGPP